MLTRRLLPIIALVSGWCGIAYELLYSRLLTTHLGDMFQVNAAILTSFLLGIGLGAALSHRVIRWLWLIEACIGLIALVVALTVARSPQILLETVLPALGHGRWTVAIAAFFFALAPAVLIGFSVPLFSAFARYHLSYAAEADAFKVVYWLYNLGAAACVLAMEYALLRTLGIRNTLLLLALFNGLSAVALRTFRPPPPEKPSPIQGDLGRRLAPALGALFGVSALSGLFQLFLLKLTEIVFGPFHENFAWLLALGLLGISLGTWAAHHWKLRFDAWLWAGAAVLGGAMFLFGPLVHFWGHLNGAFGATPLLSTLSKALVLTLMGLAPLVVFGATVPILLGEVEGLRFQSGRLLAISSFGNCLGYVLAVGNLYERLSFRALALVFPLGLMAFGLLAQRGKFNGSLWLRLLPAPLIILCAITWPSTLFQLSYRDFTSAETLEKTITSVKNTELIKRFDSALSLVRAEGEEQVIINGYRSLVSSHSGKTNISELIVGATPALYAPKREHALVLGVGTGITAGATASLFQQTDGVEINPAVAAALPRFSEHNLHLLDRPGFQLHVDDGLTALARSKQHYDAIVNTVTSPLYFSSSKLYTREFFELVKSRLTEGGVYAMWFDARVTSDGANVIFATLQKSFAHCHFVFLTPVYNELICSDAPLKPHPLDEAAWPEDLKARFAAYRLGLSMNDIFAMLILPKHRLYDKTWDAPVNSFDRPSLEFVMASASLTQQKPKAWSPLFLADVDFTVSAFQTDPLDSDGIGKRCFVFRVVSGTRNPECDRLMTQGGKTPPPLTYVDALLNTGDDDDAPRLRMSMAEHLADLGQKKRALEILTALKKPLTGYGAYEELLVGTMLDLDLPVPDETVAELYRAGPLNPGTRRMLARIAAQRGQYAEAIAHLDYLSSLAGHNKVDQTLRATWKEKLSIGRAP